MCCEDLYTTAFLILYTMNKIKFIRIAIAIFALSFLQQAKTYAQVDPGFFFGIGHAAIFTEDPRPESTTINVNYWPSFGMKFGYIFNKGIGFTVGGEFHANNRLTYLSKMGPVFSLGKVANLYPMVGYIMGDPTWNLDNGSGLYFGIGADFKIGSLMGLYLEPGFCNWNKSFMNNGTEVELLDPLHSMALAFGVSFNF